MLRKSEYEVRAAELPDDLRKVWRALRWDEWLVSEVVAERAGVERERTEQPTRELIGELIQRRFPVVSSVRGFKRATDAEELDLYARSLRSRIAGTQRRISAIEETRDEGVWEPAQYEQLDILEHTS